MITTDKKAKQKTIRGRSSVVQNQEQINLCGEETTYHYKNHGQEDVEC
jgi:hypothetical protein